MTRFTSHERKPARASRRAACAWLLASLAMAVGGCGYSLRPPYDETVKTIYVPVFRSFSFRKDANLELTEAVIKEIQKRTPYKVVDRPEEADIVLSGILTLTTKNVAVYNPQNMPRQLTADAVVDVTVEDLRPNSPRAGTPVTVRFNDSVSFYPELGETSSLGYQKTFQLLAEEIVGKLEDPW